VYIQTQAHACIHTYDVCVDTQTYTDIYTPLQVDDQTLDNHNCQLMFICAYTYICKIHIQHVVSAS